MLRMLTVSTNLGLRNKYNIIMYNKNNIPTHMFHLTVSHYIALFGAINVVPLVTRFIPFYSTDTPTMHAFLISEITTYSAVLFYLP